MNTKLNYKEKVIYEIKLVHPNLNIEVKGDRMFINGVLLKGIIICDYMERRHDINIKSILIEIEHQYLSKHQNEVSPNVSISTDTYTEQDMIDCFTAGVKFGRDMMNNPSNTEYMIIVKDNKIKQQHE